MIELFNVDCMEYMHRQPDKVFDLAIADPMYVLPKRYFIPGAEVSKGIRRRHRELAGRLANLPPTGLPYYKELCRVSKHQIIWGINYFEFAGLVPGRIVWDKKNDDSNFSNCELASCSLIMGTRIFRYRWNGMLQENMKDKEKRIHPFQKPVPLYKWLLDKYAQPGFKIIDTHFGSASSAIACADMGFDYVGCEIDKLVFERGLRRYQEFISQQKLIF